MGFLVDDWSGRLIGLYVGGFHHLRLECFVQGPEQRHRLLEPAVNSTFGKPLHAKMAVLLDLTVVRHVVLILLEQDLREQAGSGNTFIYWQQGHGSCQHTAHALGGHGGVILQTPLLADDLLDIKQAGLVLHDMCHLLADLLIEILVEIVGREYHLFQYRQVLHHDTVLLLLAALLLGLRDFLHGLVARLVGLLHLF